MEGHDIWFNQKASGGLYAEENPPWREPQKLPGSQKQTDLLAVDAGDEQIGLGAFFCESFHQHQLRFSL